MRIPGVLSAANGQQWAYLGTPDGIGYEMLPPDLTDRRAKMVCGERWQRWRGRIRRMYPCTRSPQHGLRHASGDGVKVLAVWP